MASSIGRFVPYVREHDDGRTGRRTSNATTRDALATRTCGRTVLEVYYGTAGRGLMGATQRADVYRVVAIGNASREARTLAELATLDAAERYLQAYNPRLGLLA
jgi:hypothetical protein